MMMMIARSENIFTKYFQASGSQLT